MRVRGQPRVNPKEKKKKKTDKGLGKRKVEEKRRNGKEGVREERTKAGATKSIFIEKVSSNYQCIYIQRGHYLKKTIERMHN